MSQWELDTHLRIAEGVRRARGARSAQWLADRTADLGHPITRAQIANYESGRKKTLDITELLVIAAALEVPPVVLIYPDLPDADVEVLPEQFVSSIAALIRFTGEQDKNPRTDPGKLAQLSRELFDKRVRHAVHIEVLDDLVARASGDDRAKEAAAEIDRVIDKADEIRDLKNRIREIPGAVVRDDA